MANKLINLLKNGKITIGKYKLSWSIEKSNTKDFKLGSFKDTKAYKLHIGPGAGWNKPDKEWITLDVDSTRADIVINFNDNFDRLSLNDESVKCIYGSHIFEHISVYTCPQVFKECYRILTPGGHFRLVLPDVRRSMQLYLQGQDTFPLFQHRSERAKRMYNLEYTLFECMKEDFISRSGQANLLGNHILAHQNAWDFETIVRDLCRAGFQAEHIYQLAFRKTMCPDFEFEGTYPSEANEDYRSLYVEAVKVVK